MRECNARENRIRAVGLAADGGLLALLTAFGFWVNRSIVIKGLYMDDLYMWSCYGEQSLLEFAFPIGTSTRFRPVYWLATYLQMMIVGTHIERFVTFNVVINVLVAYMLYFMGKRLSRSRLFAAAAAVCYLASRFAYYQIGQVLGLMETMALAFSVFILYELYRFMTEGWTHAGEDRATACITGVGGAAGSAAGRHAAGHGRKTRGRKDRCARRFYLALAMYFLLAFTHERYISLLPLFYLVLLVRVIGVKRGERAALLKADRWKWLLPVVVLIGIVLIRTFAIGKALPAGTGGTEVTETFHLGECISYALSQVYYLFGINAGPEHLNGLPWEQTPPEIKRMVKYSILCIGLLCLLYLAGVIFAAVRPAGKRPHVLFRCVTSCLLFGGFIGLCIACSSVTIRVEMRWIYVSYAAALLFAAYMAGFLAELPYRVLRLAALALFLAYSVLAVRTNLFYRGYFDRLYFWPNQLRMNSLAEQTVEKYGTDGVFGKDIYILENTYEMSDFYGRTFFKTFDPEKRAAGTRVIFAESLAEVNREDVRADRALVLREVPEENAYLDITEKIRNEGSTD